MNLLQPAFRFARTERARRAANVLSVVGSLAVGSLVISRLVHLGFPLAGADPIFVIAAAACFVAAAAVKAFGWARLFAVAERPRAWVLAAAGGAAAVAGLALPGRLDDALRVAVVRRFGRPAGALRVTALSLFTLGLIDAVAMTPLASTAAASEGSLPLRIGLAVVAAGGVGAAAVLVALPRFAANTRVIRFRLSRWLHDQWPSLRAAAASLAYVLAAWLARGVGTYLLLLAMGLRVSFPIAMVFMCAGAAACALPIAPAGAVTQAAAGASVLLAAGVPLSDAVRFAVAAQLLTVVVGASIVLASGVAALLRRPATAFETT